MKINEFDSFSLDEGYITPGENPSDERHEIRAKMIELMIEWYESEYHDGSGWLFVQMLPSYLAAINATGNESGYMEDVLKSAMKIIMQQYQELIQDELLVDYADEMLVSLEQLKKLQVFPDMIAAFEKSVKSSVDSYWKKFDEENPEELGETLDRHQSVREEEVWDQPNPKKKSTPLTASQKAAAKRRAKAAGRKYPNLIDNMWASKR